MRKLDIIDAELSRLHATYNHLIECMSEETEGGLLLDTMTDQSNKIQDKLLALYDIMDELDDSDDYDRYPVSDLMDDPQVDD